VRCSTLQLHRSQHGKKWFDCEPCPPSSHSAKEHSQTAASNGRPSSAERGKFMAAGDAHKSNGINNRKDSVHMKKSVDGDKSHRKSAAAGHKVRKIGM